MSGPKVRLVSLDALRGATVAGMVLVNNAGDWDHVFPQLQHAQWDGCTATDLVFPFFVFMVGCSLVLGAPKGIGSILRRTAILFALGLLLNAFPFVNLGREHVRIPGVLQRIALAYAVAAVVVRARSAVWGAVALSLAGGYGVALSALGNLTPEGNAGAWLDRLLLAGHLYKPGWDPEGLLGTLPTIATALSGALAGRWVTDSSRSTWDRVVGLLSWGGVAVLAGLALERWHPINKQLWTPSYVLFTSGLACVALAWCVQVVDVAGWQRAAWPLLVFGRNPIAAYVGSSLVARLLVYGIRPGGVQAKKLLYAATFGRWGSTPTTSVLYAASYVLVWLGIMALLDRKKIYLRV